MRLELSDPRTWIEPVTLVLKGRIVTMPFKTAVRNLMAQRGPGTYLPIPLISEAARRRDEETEWRRRRVYEMLLPKVQANSGSPGCMAAGPFSFERTEDLLTRHVKEPTTGGFFARLLANKCVHGVKTDLERCRECRREAAEALELLAEIRAWVDGYFHREEHWMSLSPIEFEAEVARVFERFGWDARTTRATGDGGVDIEVRTGSEHGVVQCKQYSKPAGPAVIRELAGAKLAARADFGVVVCSSGFTPGAAELAEELDIVLFSLSGLLQIENSDEFKLGENPDR